MRTLLSLLLCAVMQCSYSQNIFNQDVELRSCNIDIKSNSFYATTFIELELYNPTDHEIEGYRSFQLNPDQAITAFQLELNGKYRDASIEERWKALRSYSSIVGKRMDPAVLDKAYGNRYNLHVYPVPAHGSRKVSMTITQKLKSEKARLLYELPLSFADVTKSFNVHVEVSGKNLEPYFNAGLLFGQKFGGLTPLRSFSWEKKDIQLNQPISFVIDLPTSDPVICVYQDGDVKKFSMNVLPAASQYYFSNTNSLDIFWDASVSSGQRNIARELEYLERFINTNEVNELNITLFNHQILEKRHFQNAKGNFSQIRDLLKNYQYRGSTALGNLDLASVKSDMIMIFSDGRNTIGDAETPGATVPVFCVTSGPNDWRQLTKMIGASGGWIIQLENSNTNDAFKYSARAENYLYSIVGPTKIQFDQKLPLKINGPITLSGVIGSSGQIQLNYGNSHGINVTAVYNIDTSLCNTLDPGILGLLTEFESLQGNDKWTERAKFGYTRKVVTEQTAFIVLEKVEDYVKYNIAPPKDLEAECAARNYVYKPDSRLQQLKELKADQLATTVMNYNNRVRWWNSNEPLIDLSRPSVLEATRGNMPLAKVESNAVAKPLTAPTEPVAQSPSNFGSSQNLSEVVVTALGIKRQARELGYSTTRITWDELNTAKVTNAATGLAGKVAGLDVALINNGVKAETKLLLRGSRSILNNNQALLVVDEVQLPINYLSTINPNDIETVDILKGGAAAALYGSDASNGAIIVTTKRSGRGSYWQTNYKLDNQPDVDYLQEMENLSKSEYMENYLRLELSNQKSSTFYYDMAEFFFKKGMKQEATDILYKGMEITDNIYVLQGAAYIMESWKDFRGAIEIYKSLLSKDSLMSIVKHDLALAYYQNGNYQLALETYYQIITGSYSASMQMTAMNEMNALIATNSDKLDLSGINLRLVKPLPVDLSISFESNSAYGLYTAEVITPGGVEVNLFNNLNTYFYPAKQEEIHRNVNMEYSTKVAEEGRYKIRTMDCFQYDDIPHYVRIITFKHFQQKGQTLEIQNINLTNQCGHVEFGKVKW